MNDGLEIGDLVRNPAAPDWGIGQIQSIIRDRITVNFEHAGKILIDGSRIALEPEIADQWSGTSL